MLSHLLFFTCFTSFYYDDFLSQHSIFDFAPIAQAVEECGDPECHDAKLQKYEGRLKSSLADIISAIKDFFWTMGSKHCNTEGRSVRASRWTMLKDLALNNP